MSKILPEFENPKPAAAMRLWIGSNHARDGLRGNQNQKIAGGRVAFKLPPYVQPARLNFAFDAVEDRAERHVRYHEINPVCGVDSVFMLEFHALALEDRGDVLMQTGLILALSGADF